MNIFFTLGKIAAYMDAGISTPYKVQQPYTSSTSPFKQQNQMVNDTLIGEGVENILPALSLGGSTSAGVDNLYQSTLPK